MSAADTHSQATSRSAALAVIYRRLLLAAAEREARAAQAAQPAGSRDGAAPRPAGAAGERRP